MKALGIASKLTVPYLPELKRRTGHPWRTAPVVVVIVVALAGAGCGGSTKPAAPSPSPSPRVSIAVSSDFKAGAVMPRAYTCDGRDVSPPLHASGLPAASAELVVVMRDHDAPGGDFVHWGMAHLKPQRLASARTGSIALPVAARPPGAVLGLNSFGTLGYRGPCPPPGSAAHHYEITVYALGRPSMLKSGFSAAAITAQRVLATGSLTGLYARR